jgi:hypothetical protein
MNLVGKIFVFLIFVMSLVFASFAVMVFVTHSTFYEDIMRTKVEGNKPLGWKQQVIDAKKENLDLQTQYDELENRFAAMETAKRQDITRLEQEKERLLATYEVERQTNKEITAQFDKAVAELRATQNMLANMKTDNDSMRKEITAAREVITDKFRQLVKLREELNQNIAMVASQKERNEQLIVELRKAEDLLASHNIPLNQLLTKLEPIVDGFVTDVRKVRDNILVQVSLGSDDGLRKGHKLEVYRGSTYLGQITIVLAESDRAVGKVDRKFQKGEIRVGDKVLSRRGLKLTAG